MTSVACSCCSEPGPGARAQPLNRTPVEVLRLASSQYRPRVSVVADIEAWRSVEVAAELSAKVTAVLVEVGQPVKAGQTLMRVDARRQRHDLDLARAQHEQAEVDLKTSRRDLARAERLAARKLLPREQLEAARSAESRAAARLQASRARQRQSHQQLVSSAIRAPFSGIVDARYAELGDFLTPGRAVLRLVDLSQLKVRVGFPLAVRSALRIGDRCQLALREAEQATLPARLHSLSATADPRTRRVEAIFAVSRASDARPGMIAELSCFIGAARSVLMVPSTAIVQQFTIPYAYVVSAGLAQRRRLRLGATVGSKTIVLQGLSPGEQLVSAGQEALSAGMAVRIVTRRGSGG